MRGENRVTAKHVTLCYTAKKRLRMERRREGRKRETEGEKREVEEESQESRPEKKW